MLSLPLLCPHVVFQRPARTALQYRGCGGSAFRQDNLPEAGTEAQALPKYPATLSPGPGLVGRRAQGPCAFGLLM